MGRNFRTGIAVAVCALSLLAAGSAEAATATIGSPLTSAFSPNSFAVTATVVQTGLPGATLTSPFNGVITSWKIIDGGGGPYFLQVVHPAGGGTFQSTGSSPSGPLNPTGTATFQANLPIKAGDMIGLRNNQVGDMIGLAPHLAGISFSSWNPP